MKNESHLLQKISLIFSILCFLAAVTAIFIIGIYHADLSDTAIASIGATSFFLFTTGVVLKVMGRTNLKSFS